VAKIDALTRRVAELSERLQEAEACAGFKGRTAAALLKLRVKIASVRASSKPDAMHDGNSNRAPHQRRDLLRTAAARRVVGGVVEFAPSSARPSDLFENRQHLSQSEARSLSMLRWRGLCRAHGIGGRETIDQTGFQLGMGFPVGLGGFAGSAACLSCAAGLNFSAMGRLHCRDNAPESPRFHLSPWPIRHRQCIRSRQKASLSTGNTIDPEIRRQTFMEVLSGAGRRCRRSG
jgi:hypothetical protein